MILIQPLLTTYTEKRGLDDAHKITRKLQVWQFVEFFAVYVECIVVHFI